MAKRKSIKRIILFFISISTLFYFLLGHQNEQKLLKPEKHEVEVRLVLVDVIVTKDGKFVTDLTKGDFELFEDEKKVPINSFELISFGERKLEVYEEEPAEEVPLDIPKKQLIVVFDGVSTWQRNLKEGARKIVDELISLAKLGNEIMVIQLNENKGLEILQPFTREEKLIRKALVRASGNIWYDSSTDAKKMFQEVGIEATGTMAQVPRYIEAFQGILELEYLYIERLKFEKALGGILAVTNMIKMLPGRKSILLISDGFPDVSSMTLDSIVTGTTPSGTRSGARDPHLDMRRDTDVAKIFDPFNILEKKKIMSGEEVLRELIHFANAQNISIYALDPDNFIKYLMPTTAEFGPSSSVREFVAFRLKDKIGRVQNLRWLSEDTGGVSLRGAEKYVKFKQVMNTDLNYYYQLSYYPPREEPDNQYHDIKVKIKRSGLDVRYRRGYTDYSEKEEQKMLIVSAYYNPSLFKKVPFKAEFIPLQKQSRKYQPWMNIALPTKELFLDSIESYRRKIFYLHVWVKDMEKGEGTYAGQIPIPFNINSSFMNLVKQTEYLCFHYKGPEIPVEHKEYKAIFALFDEQTNEIGTWESFFSFPDDKKDKDGAIINCVLGLLTPDTARRKKSLDLSSKDGGLEYGEIKFFPAVTNQFQRMQNASVFLQVYLPQGRTKISPNFSVLIRKDLAQSVPAEKVVESWDKKSKIWSVIFNLDLASVFPGDYILKVNLPVSEETVLSQEVKLFKLEY